MGAREVKRYPTIEYCNNPPKVEKYKKLVLIDLCPTRFVKYNDLEGFGMEYFRQNCSDLANLFDYDNQKPYYPDLVNLFYEYWWRKRYGNDCCQGRIHVSYSCGDRENVQF